MNATTFPPFYLLNGALGWRGQAQVGGGIIPGQGAGSSMRLSADPRGALRLDTPGGTLGGLVLPRGMALDAQNRLYLLQTSRAWQILRYQPDQQRFVILPSIGGEGSTPRLFSYPRGLAIAGRELFVADTGNRRIQGFDLDSLALLHVWGMDEINQAGQATWQPVDVAAGSAGLYVLDAAAGRVYFHRLSSDRLERLIDLPEGGTWTRLVLDQNGRIYAANQSKGSAAVLRVYSASGVFVEEVHDAGEVRSLFAPPPLRLLYDARRPGSRPYFCLPTSLERLCNRQEPEAAPLPEVPLGLCAPWNQDNPGQIFRLDGKPVVIDPAEVLETPLYQTEGVWISDLLNSGKYQCQWHRILLDFERFPPGSRVVISTRSADEGGTAPDQEDPLWQVGFSRVAEMQPPGGSTQQNLDFLIQSRPGQYLWLKVEFFGDGFDSPLLSSLRVYFPRESYLSYLPAIFSAEDDSRWFLERFLSIFQTEIGYLEKELDRVENLFNTSSVPAENGWLENLAGWLAQPLEGTWTAEQNRALLSSTGHFFPKRGTAEGLRVYMLAYLKNITGLAVDMQSDFPRLVEGYRLRQRLMLAGSDADTGAQAQLLWGPAMVDRLQTGVFARAGEVRLVSTGDPQHDLFHEYAHKFRIFLPAVWIPNADAEQVLRRAIEAEKPAHTSYELCLVEPRLRVGIQSTVGVDTIVGDYPVARLACQAVCDTAAPSRAPRGRLGYDTILGGKVNTVRRLPIPVGSPIQ